MEEFIEEHLCAYDFAYDKIPSTHILGIYQLYHDDKFNEMEDGIMSLHHGIYHKLNKNYGRMIQCWLKAINDSDVNAMINLADYYESLKQYDNAIRYYSMAVDYGKYHQLENLAMCYYHNNNYDNAIKYELIRTSKFSCSTNNLAIYCEYNNDLINAMKYYSMAIDSGCTMAMFNLGSHYGRKNDASTCMKYYHMVITHKNYNRIHHIINHCKNNNLIGDLIIVFNNILNIQFNDLIVKTLLELPIEYDSLNVLININQTKCKSNDIFSLLPN